MKKRKLTKQAQAMSTSKQIATSVIALAIVIGLIGYYHVGFDTTQASQPPGGNVPQEIYVNNVQGNDVTGDGSLAKPYASPEKAFKVANGSFADLVKIWITGTGKAYRLSTDLGFKRSNLEVAGYGRRPLLVGATEGFRLYEFDIDDTWGNKIIGIDTINLRVRASQGHQLTIDKMNFLISDLSRLDKPIIWVQEEHAGTPDGVYVNNDVAITRNVFTVTAPADGKYPVTVGIQVESVKNSQIAMNSFKSAVWDAAIKIIDATSIQTGANTMSKTTNSAPLYWFNKANVSQVYPTWSM